MNNINSFNLICDIINSSDYKTNDVYFDVLLKLSNNFPEIKNKSCSIFFIEDLNSSLRAGINNGNRIDNYKADKLFFEKFSKFDKNYLIIKTNKDNLLYQNTILIKLSIRKSVFGYLIFSCDNSIEEELAIQLLSIANVIAYKIKDYELNSIFKIQLKAMQDAISEKNEAYEIIKKQHKKLQELDKTKNLFLANISHELRTPLNAIIGFSQALSSKIFGDLNEKQSEYINDIQISSLHLLGMINEILDISKIEANAMKFTPSEMNANQSIREVVNVLEPLYKNKNISLVFEQDQDIEIKADYQKFQQILYNLLSNAIKFTPENGKIKIKSFAQDKNYNLEISDTGVGIDKKYHNKIFKKFVHLNNIYSKSQNSTGLGLTITKELVKLHNGKIKLESELGKGTTFKMEFKNIII